MKIIRSLTNDSYTNIATEEYLLKNFNDDIFFLYINSNSIIVGKHQNTLSEINFNYITQNNIPVVRRLSGGGTVFHDAGNINFCFIANGAKGELVNFKKYTQPIVDYLKTLNINAAIGGRNDILIDGCKISGNASHVYKNRVMHHGTLLFKSELETLTNSLKNDPLKFKDKAVKSVRSKVTNIQSHLQENINVNEFTDKLYQYIVDTYQAEAYEINDDDYASIHTLVENKFNTWDWNFGYSPKYELRKRIKGNNNTRFEIALKVHKGIIEDVEIKSNSKQKEWLTKLSTELKECNHSYESTQNKIKHLFNDQTDLSLHQLLEAIF